MSAQGALPRKSTGCSHPSHCLPSVFTMPNCAFSMICQTNVTATTGATYGSSMRERARPRPRNGIQNPGSVKTVAKLSRVSGLTSPFSAMLVKSVSWKARTRFQITGMMTIARTMIVVGRTITNPARLSRLGMAEGRGRPLCRAARGGVGGGADRVIDSLLQLRLQLIDGTGCRRRRIARACPRAETRGGFRHRQLCVYRSEQRSLPLRDGPAVDLGRHPEESIDRRCVVQVRQLLLGVHTRLQALPPVGELRGCLRGSGAQWKLALRGHAEPFQVPVGEHVLEELFGRGCIGVLGHQPRCRLPVRGPLCAIGALDGGDDSAVLGQPGRVGCALWTRRQSIVSEAAELVKNVG